MFGLRFKFLLLILSLVVGAQAEPRNQGCAKGEKAFMDSLYDPILNKLNCVSCHAQLNTAAAPVFMKAAEAYQNSLSKANFVNIHLSKFVEKVTDSHFASHGVPIKIKPEAMHDAIKAWWDNGQKECKGTALVAAIKDEVFDQDAIQTLTWDLRAYGKAFEEVFFEVQVKKRASTSDKNFQLSFENPKLISYNHPVKVKSIKLKMSGQTTTAGFEQVYSVRDAQDFLGKVRDPKFFPKLSVLPVRINVTRPATVEFSFDQVEQVESAECSNVALFKKQVAPKLQRCIHCHETRPTEIAYKRQPSGFFMNTATDESFCQSVKAVAMARSTVESLLFQLFLQKDAHPPLLFPFPESDDDRREISTWILSEIKGAK